MEDLSDGIAAIECECGFRDISPAGITFNLLLLGLGCPRYRDILRVGYLRLAWAWISSLKADIPPDGDLSRPLAISDPERVVAFEGNIYLDRYGALVELLHRVEKLEAKCRDS